MIRKQAIRVLNRAIKTLVHARLVLVGAPDGGAGIDWPRLTLSAWMADTNGVRTLARLTLSRFNVEKLEARLLSVACAQRRS